MILCLIIVFCVSNAVFVEFSSGYGLHAQSIAQTKPSKGASDDSLAFEYHYRRALALNDPKPDSALAAACQAEIFARRRNNPREISLALSIIASALTDIGSSVEAVKQGRTAFMLAKECGDTLAMAWALFSVGYASGQRLDGRGGDSANNAAALALMLEGLSYSTRATNADLTINFYDGIGRLFRKMGQFDSALAYHFHAYSLAKSVKNTVQQGWAAYGIATSFESQNHLKKALDFALESVALRQKVGKMFPIAISLGGVAAIIAKMGDKRSALNYAKLSLRYADSSGLLVTRTNAVERVARIAAEAGDYKEAFLWFQRYVALRDSVMMQEQQNDVRSLAQELEIERGKKEKAQQQQQQQQQQAIIRQQSIIAVSIAVVAVFLTIAIFAVIRAQRVTRHKQILAEQYAATIEHTNHRLDEVNQTLSQKNAHLEQLNHEKEEILNIVAHDLKNPISAIHGLAELFQAGIVQPEQTPVVAEQIVHTSDRMLALVTNLLNINRLESGLVQFHTVAFDITPLIDDAVMQFRAQADAKRIHFEVQFPDVTIPVFADEQAMMQVLDNLVSNAVKYSPHCKNVFVRVCHSPLVIGHSSDGSIPHPTDQVLNATMTNVPMTNVPMTKDSTTNGFLRIEVQDEGEGISGDDMKKLFGKFARLSARPTSGEHSTGLGLSIVKKLVEAMHGRIWCESEVGKGATFIVELPTKHSHLTNPGIEVKRIL